MIDQTEDPEDRYAVLDPHVETGVEFYDPEYELDFEFPDECVICHYDLRGSLESMRCPECGADIRESVKLMEKRAAHRSEALATLGILRWIAFGMIPVLAWVPVAFFLYRSNDPFWMWMILPTGLVAAMGAVVWGSVQAGEEARDDGLGWVMVVCLTLCVGNLFVLILTFKSLML